MRRGLSLALAAALLLSGCGALPRPREMGDMALLRVMGVDRGEGGPAMSAATGPQAPEQPARLWQGEGTSLSAAAQAIQSRSDRYVFFGYVDQLLLGEDQSRRGVEDIFAYVARDTQLSLAARLWIIQDGDAHGALEAGGDQGVESRLATLAADGEMGLSIRPRRVGEVYAQLLEQGCSYAPALTVGEAERETVCRHLETLAERELASALEQLRAWKADCAGLGPRAALSDPGLWSKLEPDWPEVFSRLEPELIVQADLPGG